MCHPELIHPKEVASKDNNLANEWLDKYKISFGRKADDISGYICNISYI